VNTDPDARWYTNQATAQAEATDEQLVAAALNADRAAFRTLVRRHQRALVNHLYRHIGHRESALDLAQEVFLKIYLSLSTFDPKYRFTTWLYRIASNCAIDHLRKKRPLTYSLTTNPNDSYPSRRAKALAGNEPDPDDMLRYQELQGRLEMAVQNLPADYRQLILLRHRQHCRYDEIARIAKLPIGTVKNRIFRARELLKRELADVLDEEVQNGEL
jgi:RNA polymerase sigma-70 factor (ECF subfamily)